MGIPSFRAILSISLLETSGLKQVQLRQKVVMELPGMGGGGGMSSAASTSATGAVSYAARGIDSKVLLIAGLIALGLLAIFIMRK